MGREPFDEGPSGLGGGRLEVGLDPVETETLGDEGGLSLCGRVCFDGIVDLCSQSVESTSAVESPPALGSSFTT